MTGEEQLDIRPTGDRGKARVNDALYALQNRASEKGMIDPDDHSDQAKKIIASDIADEVKYHVDNSDKSAIGWYDAALKKAKGLYHQIFPELKTDKDKEMPFDAILGITSQGNDVHSNSIFAARMYDKIRNEGKSIPEAVKDLSGGFGAKIVESFAPSWPLSIIDTFSWRKPARLASWVCVSPSCLRVR